MGRRLRWAPDYRAGVTGRDRIDLTPICSFISAPSFDDSLFLLPTHPASSFSPELKSLFSGFLLDLTFPKKKKNRITKLVLPFTYFYPSHFFFYHSAFQLNGWDSRRREVSE